MSHVRWQAAVRYGLPGLVAGLAIACLLGGQPVLQAQAQVPLPAQGQAQAAGVLAFTSGMPGGTQWLYLVDTRAQTFAVYRVEPQNNRGVVKLEAARHYQWDMMLAEYNNQQPEVAAIESMVKAKK